MIDLTLALIILAVAVGTGVLSATVGVGGGFIMVSFMLAYMSYTSQQAAGTSAFVIIFSALSSSIAYFRQKRIDYKVGVMAALFSVPAALIGGYVTKLLPSALIAFLFAISLVIVGVKMVFFPREKNKDVGLKDKKGDLPKDETKKKDQREKPRSGWTTRIIDAAGHEFTYHANVLPAIPFFILAGFLSGLFGIGGGVVIVPALQIIVGLPLHLAVATSMFTMIFTSISSGTTHIVLGNVIFDYALLFIIGIIAGAQGGARVAWRIKSSSIERVFGVTMLLISIYLLLKYNLL
ncbi:MAG: sulfite exporter TauE/SafE family protein [Promethearchaeati archaeon SRVP18_Atabeyarchaeia-1]